MAEILNNAYASRGKRIIHSTRVDLTPMVDLGFLLLTFFVFCSTMGNPTSMKLIVPDNRSIDNTDINNVKNSGALTILLGAENKIYYFEGVSKSDHSNWKVSNLSAIRNVIIEKRKTTNSNDFVVLIKPGDKSNYASLVNILDEMKINLVDRYTLMDIEPGEETYMNRLK